MASKKQNPITKVACGFCFPYIHPQLQLENDVTNGCYGKVLHHIYLLTCNHKITSAV